MPDPVISVVMGVYNGGKYLRETVDSILAQTFKDFEFIIVNDGSRDDTGKILRDYANRDQRIKIIEQQNQGLTKALIAGCQLAQGEYICRQDCGDISKPRRLEKQLGRINAEKGIALVSCAVNFFGPEGELIFSSSCKLDDPSAQKGVSWHGTAFFSAELYRRSGGYRSEFYFAQDLDLWTRLLKYGKACNCPEVLYEARFAEGQISGIYRREQVALTGIIHALRKLYPDEPKYKVLLRKASLIRPKDQAGISGSRRAEQFYFLGRCLKSQGNPAYRRYLWQCIKNNPLHFKGWISLLV
jgi:glycosyltransferase involved in cell wall biosynthesis